MATAFGCGCGLPFIFFPLGSWYGAIGGAVLGLCGGPAFGLAIGTVDLVARSRERSDPWRIGASAGAGAAVFGLVPIVVGLARGHGLDIDRHNLAEALFGLAVAAAAGAFLGWMVASLRREAREKKPRNGWSELEL
ncbi:MAG TPA: hypothetical protein VGH33_25405 [Isosphaeraceae bacterium]